ncbi:LysR family transcriptional regulator [Aestuariibacter sp. AA17]|uniref:LysR family transcriptional regulator n=1 Tax=Fluctibacter corallii TaxID=2984329 RepID=A0ABT3AD48_9ALTE|nr:LysR family transcriptional regulator [Aestuariibacter sp. AA17]MCV2886589.1 LysR family transcriptional regulator [Aestuariibacter sp. AA17]
MDLRSLKYFVAVYESGSFSAASKRLYIAQPSISSAIKQLEDSLSKPLFLRYPRGIKPTEAGQQLYPLAQQLLGQASAIRDVFRDKHAKEPFRLGLIKGLGVARMSALLKQFTSKVNTLELSLVPPEDVCDARIISDDMLHPKETFIPIWQDRFKLVLPVGHPLRLKESLTITDLHDLAFIQRSPCEGWNLLREALHLHNVHVDVRAKIQTIEYAIGLVRAGLGCAFIPIHDSVNEDSDILHDLVCLDIDHLSLCRNIGLAFQKKTDTINVLSHLAAQQH